LVDFSFSGKKWVFLNGSEEDIEDIVRKTGISDTAARILVNRNIDLSEIDSFLNVKLKNVMPDPLLLLDMGKAIERIIQAINHHERIFVFGDYDVDGITSTFILVKYLKLAGADVESYVPSRFIEGYGITPEVIEKAKEMAADLFVAVDSGITAIEPVDVANNFGLDVLIFDHHTPLEKLPRAIAVVNPNRFDQDNLGRANIKSLCAAGVVFMFLVGLQRELRSRGFFDDQRKEPDIMHFISSVALATLCDVMELKGINRAFVNYGMATNCHVPGILALMSLFNLSSISCVDHFSFLMGPVINAAGRVSDPNLALSLFLSDEFEETMSIARKLVSLNTERKVIEKSLLAEALACVSADNLNNNNAICVFGTEWSDGV
jgi:single-stranded-DNA-specific exonuclease